MFEHRSIRFNPILFNQDGTTWQSVWKVVYTVQIEFRERRKLLMNGQRPQYFLAKAIPQFNYINVYHCTNNHGRYGDGFHNFEIDDQDGHILSPLIMFTFTALHNALLEWPKNNSVHLNAAESKLDVDRLDRSNHFDCKNDDGQNASCYAAIGVKLSASSGVADTCTFLLNTWTTLPKSYQQRVYNNTPATVKL